MESRSSWAADETSQVYCPGEEASCIPSAHERLELREIASGPAVQQYLEPGKTLVERLLL